MLMINCKRMKVNKDDIIFQEGEPSNYMYFIQKGEVRLYKEMGTDKEVTIFLRHTQDGFGEIGIFSGGKYSNTAQATQDCELYYIEKESMETIVSQSGRFGLHLTRWVAESLEASKAKIRDYVAFGSEGAVASIFIRYSNMYGIVTPEGIKITEPIMLRDISKHIGISRETVSRVVSEWKRNKILTSEGRYFLIKEIDYFRELLHCDKCGVINCVL